MNSPVETSADSLHLKEIIRQTWAIELQCEGIAGDANFFEIGGNSLSAVSMLVNLSWKIGCKFDFEAFFEDATIDGLYRIVIATKHESGQP